MAKELKYEHPDEFYIPSTIAKAVSDKSAYADLRKEYTRLRDIAQKRIKRMYEAGYEKTETYQQHKGGFRKLKDLSKKDFPKAMAELQQFVSSKTSSVSGLQTKRDKFLTSMHNSGYEGINVGNYNEYMDFLKHVHTMHQDKAYDSDQVRKAFLLMKEKDIAKTEFYKNFDYYMNKLNELAALTWDDNKKHHSAKEFREALGIDEDIARDKAQKALFKATRGKK